MTLSNIGTFVFYVFWFIAASLSLKHSKKSKCDLAFVIAVLIPGLIAGLRLNVGVDYENYKYIYEEMSAMSLKAWFVTNFGVLDGSRIGIWIVGKVAALFHSSAVFFGLTGLLSVVPVAAFIKYYFDDRKYFLPYFIFLLTTYSSGLNIVKQAIAVAFVVLSLKYVFERKLWRFVICIVCAASFHISALLAMVLYFTYDPKRTKYITPWKTVILGFFILVTASFDRILLFLGGRFSSYIDYEGEIFNRSFYLKIALLALFIIVRTVSKGANKKYNTLLFIYLLGVGLMLVGFTSPYTKRVSGYFTCVEFILLPMIGDASHGKNRFVLYGGIIFYVFAVYIISYYVLEQSGIVPYTFITV